MELEVHKRIATAVDLPALQALIHQAYRGKPSSRTWTHEGHLVTGQRVDQEMMIEHFQTPRAVFTILESQGEALACAYVKETTPGQVYIGLISVEPSLHAMGLGKQILDWTEAVAVKEFDAYEAELSVITERTELWAWYQRRGYVDCNKVIPFPEGNARFGIVQKSGMKLGFLKKRLVK